MLTKTSPLPFQMTVNVRARATRTLVLAPTERVARTRVESRGGAMKEEGPGSMEVGRGKRGRRRRWGGRTRTTDSRVTAAR